MAGHGEEKKKDKKEHGHEDEGPKYTYEPQHEEVYKHAMNAVPLKEHIARAKRHRKGWAPALKVMEDKEINNLDEGIEAMADAIIQYRKTTKLPVSEDKEDRHYIISEIEAWVKDWEKSNKTSAEQYFKIGKGHEVLTDFLKYEYERDIVGKVAYEMKKALPEGEKPAFYKGVANVYAKETGAQLTEGELTKMGDRDTLLHYLNQHYHNLVMSKTKFMPGKKEEDDKHHAGASHATEEHGAAGGGGHH